MKFLVQILLFPFILLISGAALLIGFAVAKEGYGSLWIWAGIAGFLGLLLFGWQRVHSKVKSLRGLYWAGLAALTLPLLLYIFVLAYGTYLWVGGQLLMMHARVVEYRETPIYWTGLADPIGVRVELTVSVPFKPTGVFHPPQIIVAPTKQGDGEPEALSCYGVHEHYACLTEPIGLFRSTAVITDNSATHLSFDLYSTSVAYLNPQAKVCLATSAPPLRKGFGERQVIWRFATGMHVFDLGPLLETTISQRSRLLGAQDVLNLERVLSPAKLEQLGYRLCHSSPPGSTCYCR